jgi:hypothetical protein
MILHGSDHLIRLNAIVLREFLLAPWEFPCLSVGSAECPDVRFWGYFDGTTYESGGQEFESLWARHFHFCSRDRREHPSCRSARATEANFKYGFKQETDG